MTTPLDLSAPHQHPRWRTRPVAWRKPIRPPEALSSFQRKPTLDLWAVHGWPVKLEFSFHLTASAFVTWFVCLIIHAALPLFHCLTWHVSLRQSRTISAKLRGNLKWIDGSWRALQLSFWLRWDRTKPSAAKSTESGRHPAPSSDLVTVSGRFRPNASSDRVGVKRFSIERPTSYPMQFTSIELIDSLNGNISCETWQVSGSNRLTTFRLGGCWFSFEKSQTCVQFTSKMTERCGLDGRNRPPGSATGGRKRPCQKCVRNERSCRLVMTSGHQEAPPSPNWSYQVRAVSSNGPKWNDLQSRLAWNSASNGILRADALAFHRISFNYTSHRPSWTRRSKVLCVRRV